MCARMNDTIHVKIEIIYGHGIASTQTFTHTLQHDGI